MRDSTVLTVGTALSRARDAGAFVEILVQGQWITGLVSAIDGYGAVLSGELGQTAVVRLELVSAVKVIEHDLTQDPAQYSPHGEAQVRAHHGSARVHEIA